MSMEGIASAVSKYAPLLASVISESNPIAGLVIGAIAKLFGVNTDESSILAAMSSDPNVAVKLKQMELEHQQAIMANQVNDKIDARAREERIIELTGKRDWILDTIALTVIIGFFLICILNYFVHLGDDHIVSMLMGQISSGFMLCLGYYFGSSNK